MSLSWVGRNWQARKQAGVTQKPAAEFVQQRFERGFTWLKVTDDQDRIVGWIKTKGKGEREWWAEGKS